MKKKKKNEMYIRMAHDEAPEHRGEPLIHDKGLAAEDCSIWGILKNWKIELRSEKVE